MTRCASQTTRHPKNEKKGSLRDQARLFDNAQFILQDFVICVGQFFLVFLI